MPRLLAILVWDSSSRKCVTAMIRSRAGIWLSFCHASEASWRSAIAWLGAGTSWLRLLRNANVRRCHAASVFICEIATFLATRYSHPRASIRASNFGKKSLAFMKTVETTSSATSARPPQYLNAHAYTCWRCAANNASSVQPLVAAGRDATVVDSTSAVIRDSTRDCRAGRDY